MCSAILLPEKPPVLCPGTAIIIQHRVESIAGMNAVTVLRLLTTSLNFFYLPRINTVRGPTCTGQLSELHCAPARVSGCGVMKVVRDAELNGLFLPSSL